jgi:hypothetical protein
MLVQLPSPCRCYVQPPATPPPVPSQRMHLRRWRRRAAEAAACLTHDRRRRAAAAVATSGTKPSPPASTMTSLRVRLRCLCCPCTMLLAPFNEHGCWLVCKPMPLRYPPPPPPNHHHHHHTPHLKRTLTHPPPHTTHRPTSRSHPSPPHPPHPPPSNTPIHKLCRKQTGWFFIQTLSVRMQSTRTLRSHVAPTPSSWPSLRQVAGDLLAPLTAGREGCCGCLADGGSSALLAMM